MHLDLTELKSTIPADVLSTILQRALQQIDADAQRYRQAIQAAHFTEGAQLIHSVRGLALFLGVNTTDLTPLQRLENELSTQSTASNPCAADMTAFIGRFDAFHASFVEALHLICDRP